MNSGRYGVDLQLQMKHFLPRQASPALHLFASLQNIFVYMYVV